MESEPDHYETLGINPSATDRDIKVSFRALALKYHPDKNKDPDAEEKFKVITGAYSVLADKVLLILCQFIRLPCP